MFTPSTIRGNWNQICRPLVIHPSEVAQANTAQAGPVLFKISTLNPHRPSTDMPNKVSSGQRKLLSDPLLTLWSTKKKWWTCATAQPNRSNHGKSVVSGECWSILSKGPFQPISQALLIHPYEEIGDPRPSRASTFYSGGLSPCVKSAPSHISPRRSFSGLFRPIPGHACCFFRVSRARITV